MSDPTRPTGATEFTGASEESIQLAIIAARGTYRQLETFGAGGDHWPSVVLMAARQLVPPDQCIVPRSFIAAVDAAIDEAEELDDTTPYVRIPLGKWHDLENARDTFREGLRSSEPPSTAHATTVAQLERQCSLTFAAITGTIDGLIARIAALEAEIEGMP